MADLDINPTEIALYRLAQSHSILATIRAFSAHDNLPDGDAVSALCGVQDLLYVAQDGMDDSVHCDKSKLYAV